VWVEVLVRLVPDQCAHLSQAAHDLGVGLEHLQALPVRHLVGESSALVHGDHHANPVRLAQALVVLSEARGHVHRARALVLADKVSGKQAEGLRLRREEVEERHIRPADEPVTPYGPGRGGSSQLLGIVSGGARPEDPALRVLLVHRVLDGRIDGDGEI
jgi:hypothetical protein